MKRTGTITNLETLGSEVDYNCVIADNEAGKNTKTIDCSMVFENSKLVFEVHLQQSSRNKFFGVKAARAVNSNIIKISGLAPLGTMCKPFDKFENGNCVTPTLPPLVKPEIRVISDNAPGGSKTVEISNMELGAHYSCIVKDDAGRVFDPGNCKIDNPDGAYTRTFTVGSAFNGKTLKVFAEKDVAYRGSKAHITENSNTVLIEDTVAKDCSYTNIVHSKDATGMV
ncbi:MAG TPA: hypothetical protein VKR58_03605, partial [Aquella sp.]|nr:hypothetical protein [Aquella sp.]